MPSSLTKLGVWNLAIDLLRETAMQAPDDGSAAGRWLERNWQHTVEELLRMYPWNFAKERFILPAENTAPKFKWSFAYKPPAGWLRVLPITRYGERFGDEVKHEIVGDRIETNEPAPLYVTCIMDKTANPGLWDPLFVTMVKCTLALGMSPKFSGKATLVDRAQKMLDRATEKAEEIDAFEGSAEPIEAFDILRVRGVDTTIPGRG